MKKRFTEEQIIRILQEGEARVALISSNSQARHRQRRRPEQCDIPVVREAYAFPQRDP